MREHVVRETWATWFGGIEKAVDYPLRQRQRSPELVYDFYQNLNAEKKRLKLVEP